MEFMHLQQAVSAQFARLMTGQPFRITLGVDSDGNDTTKDKLWDAYMNAFPEGTNPIFRTRREYDCNCCKRFIRAVGNIIAVVDGKLETVWDVQAKNLEPGFVAVCSTLSEIVKGAPIADEFLHYEAIAGSKPTKDLLSEKPLTWNHFFVNISAAYVVKGDDLATKLSKSRSTAQVFRRALDEVNHAGVEAVLDLITANNLYRGEQFKSKVERFAELQKKYMGLKSDRQREVFAWSLGKTEHESVTHIRNSAIGTLLVDLSNDMELEDAVRKYETSTVAPSNFQRSSSLVTKVQVQRATEAVRELGLETALARRYAILDDISLPNVIFADRKIKLAAASVLDELDATAPTKLSMDKLDEVPVDRFIKEVLPRAHHLDVFLQNSHESRMVSLLTAVDPTANQLFKWTNPFSWDYSGGVTDAIKERVKQAGGAITGDLCCRLAWDNRDDLDFHMVEPSASGRGYEIYYGNLRRPSPNGGVLDTDSNGMDGIRANPVENIVYPDRRRMREGDYELSVVNYNSRTAGGGFTVEVEFDGQKFTFVQEKVVRQGERVVVATISYSKASGFSIKGVMPSTTASKDMWGLRTQQWQPVTVVMNSPNFWDGQEGHGNRHWFFMLNGARRPDKARGFYNEYLHPSLHQHRKVLEIAGAKSKVEDSENQLGGIGISSTQRETLVCRVRGSATRTVKVVF